MKKNKKWLRATPVPRHPAFDSAGGGADIGGSPLVANSKIFLVREDSAPLEI